MLKSIRVPTTAALLLLPLAAAVIPHPALAQQRVVVTPAIVAPAPAPGIERFTMRSGGRVAPGRELRFRMHAAPGGQASLEIPGVVRDIALRESRPGVYEGAYTVRRRDDLGAFDRAVATLRMGNQVATAKLELPGADRDVGRRDDARPPVIGQVSPANGDRIDERGRTSIRANFSDEGTGVDAGSIRLTVDGLDVTRNARVSSEDISYRERLGRGPHRAELVVRDRAGNVTRSAWSFRVV